MSEQTSIPKHKITRAAKLAGTGVKVGVNYLKYKQKQKGLDGDAAEEAFHDFTAAETYSIFSELKGGPLKLAQILSLDKNMMPSQYVDEFSKAQYSAPPLSYPLVVKTFEKEFGKKPNELFDEFTQSAVAGASIGQVHQAKKDGQTYAVKVQYPGVAQSLNSDLAIVKPIAMRLFKLNSKTIEPYLKEVKARLSEETDYEFELNSSMELVEKSKDLPNTKFPQYYPELSTKRILTMQWVDGLLFDQYIESDATKAERNHIGQTLWDFYAHQIHELLVFHADPHPGNFKVLNDELWVLDFGCVKTITPQFYQEYFKLMDPEVYLDDAIFTQALYDIQILLPSDKPEEVNRLVSLMREASELLARPFASKTFNFGDESYFEELAAFGERNRLDQELKQLSTARGNADALYLNKTFFSLYNLLGSLNATVDTSKGIEG